MRQGAVDDPRDPAQGASLVGVVVVLVILGGLGALAVAALPDDPDGTSGQVQSLAPAAAPSGAGGGARSPTAGAGLETCLLTARTLQAATEANHAADGTYPATVTELVTAGYLSEEPAMRGYVFTMEASGSRPTVRVLVNDLPAEQGCATPRPGR